MNKYLNNIKEFFFTIFFIEILSFSAFYFQSLNNIFFISVVLAFFLVSIYRFEYGIYIVLGELFIGSMGGLFYFEYNGILLSIRIAMWIIISSLWIAKTLISLYRKRGNIVFLKSRYSKFFIALFLFVIWGVVNGLLHENGYNNLFFDVNGWLYFTLIFPIYDCLLQKNNKFEDTRLFFVMQILVASVFWMCFKTLSLLFIFSHNLHGIMSIFYEWVRGTRVGEITKMPDGFMRIFFQSHIFVVILFFLILFMLNDFLHKNNFSFQKIKEKGLTKILIYYFLILVVLMSVIIIGFSRSIWVGFVLALFFYILYIAYLYKIKKAVLNFFIIFLLLISSYIFIFGVVKIPLPGKISNEFTIKTVQNRVSDVGESAVSSRWSLLPLLWHDVKNNFFIGSGYGKTITYKSSDPRVLQSSINGEYTTYAFEWGWIDIWLKIGFFGLFVYIFLIIKIFLDVILNKKMLKNYLAVYFCLGLLFLVVVNFFTPYFNHPLGIGYLILTVVFIDYLYLNKSSDIKITVS